MTTGPLFSLNFVYLLDFAYPGYVGGVVDGRDGVPITASQSIGQSSPPRAKVVVKMQPTQALNSSSHCPSVQEPHCSASCVEINQ